ncbi:hypothetical protein [Bifidobacterium sp. ESL0682]|uniref:helix-turn-helix domain-containing transcriptional regulator n=1 Tax=Bifidobacterium sp. ESL0682 TaxID=2983212 RepID=UPI0032B0163D
MTAIADRANVGRPSLYKSLKKGANPSFRTVYSTLRELFGGASPLFPAKLLDFATGTTTRTANQKRP